MQMANGNGLRYSVPETNLNTATRTATAAIVYRIRLRRPTKRSLVEAVAAAAAARICVLGGPNRSARPWPGLACSVSGLGRPTQ